MFNFEHALSQLGRKTTKHPVEQPAKSPEKIPDNQDKLSPFFKKALIRELNIIIQATQGLNDQQKYKELRNTINDEGPAFQELLSKSSFSLNDINEELNKRYNDGSVIPLSEKSRDVIQYLMHLVNLRQKEKLEEVSMEETKKRSTNMVQQKGE